MLSAWFETVNLSVHTVPDQSRVVYQTGEDEEGDVLSMEVPSFPTQSHHSANELSQLSCDHLMPKRTTIHFTSLSSQPYSQIVTLHFDKLKMFCQFNQRVGLNTSNTVTFEHEAADHISYSPADRHHQPVSLQVRESLCLNKTGPLCHHSARQPA